MVNKYFDLVQITDALKYKINKTNISISNDCCKVNKHHLTLFLFIWNLKSYIRPLWRRYAIRAQQFDVSDWVADVRPGSPLQDEGPLQCEQCDCLDLGRLCRGTIRKWWKNSALFCCHLLSWWILRQSARTTATLCCGWISTAKTSHGVHWIQIDWIFSIDNCVVIFFLRFR